MYTCHTLQTGSQGCAHRLNFYRFDCRKSRELFSLFNIVSVISTPKTGEYVFKNRNTFIATPRMAVTGQQYG